MTVFKKNMHGSTVLYMHICLSLSVLEMPITCLGHTNQFQMACFVPIVNKTLRREIFHFHKFTSTEDTGGMKELSFLDSFQIFKNKYYYIIISLLNIMLLLR
uniref:Uncharacterized protein n=1 Tax=Micrurus lemniscatus lemniscatus TaxID=129467 RepID=A0A2D4JJX9_MICLE